jgi:hypothetical protein
LPRSFAKREPPPAPVDRFAIRERRELARAVAASLRDPREQREEQALHGRRGRREEERDHLAVVVREDGGLEYGGRRGQARSGELPRPREAGDVLQEGLEGRRRPGLGA